MEDVAVEDGGVLVEDSDVDEGGASTYTQREVTASGIEKRRVGRQMASESGLPTPYWLCRLRRSQDSSHPSIEYTINYYYNYYYYY